jgi:hypothetical protein
MAGRCGVRARIAMVACLMALGGPALAQTAPGYRMVTPPQQTPLPWHTQPAPAPQAQPRQPPPPSLSQNVENLRQHRQQEQRQLQQQGRIANTLRQLDR